MLLLRQGYFDGWKAIRDQWGENQYELEAYPGKPGAPFAVVCAGGGYELVWSWSEGRPYARALNRLGYNAFVLKYRVKELPRYPAPQEDLARAIRYILDHAEELQVSTANYAVFGSSAGGHLAASFGTKTMGYERFGLPKPATLCLAYPVICMDERGHMGTTKNLLGEKPTQEAIWEKRSQTV